MESLFFFCPFVVLMTVESGDNRIFHKFSVTNRLVICRETPKACTFVRLK